MLIENLAKKENEQALKADYVKKLLRGLGGEPENYEYKGEIVDCGDDGRCACTHKIRQGFVLHHKTRAGETKVVGSTCINYFEAINEELWKALLAGLKELEARKAAALAANKAAKAQAEVDALKAEFEAKRGRLVWEFESYRARGMKAPRELWDAVASSWRIESKAPEYTRASDYKSWYKKRIGWIEAKAAYLKIDLADGKAVA